MGATAPTVASNPTPVTPGTATAVASNATAPTSGVDDRLNNAQRPRGLTPEQGHQADIERRKKQQQTMAPAAPLAGAGPANANALSTPLLNQAMANSTTLQGLTQQATSRFSPMATPQAQANANSVAPQSQGQSQGQQAPVYQQQRQYRDVNLDNPEGNPDRPYDQGHSGGTRGYLEGVGQTIAPGRSITPALAQQQILQAINQGVDPGYIQDFLARNPGDTNRIIEGYNSERRNTRGGSWQDYDLPSADEARNYFGE
jgi:hypothetical protein